HRRREFQFANQVSHFANHFCRRQHADFHGGNFDSGSYSLNLRAHRFSRLMRGAKEFLCVLKRQRGDCGGGTTTEVKNCPNISDDSRAARRIETSNREYRRCVVKISNRGHCLTEMDQARREVLYPWRLSFATDFEPIRLQVTRLALNAAGKFRIEVSVIFDRPPVRSDAL